MPPALITGAVTGLGHGAAAELLNTGHDAVIHNAGTMEESLLSPVNTVVPLPADSPAARGGAAHPPVLLHAPLRQSHPDRFRRERTGGTGSGRLTDDSAAWPSGGYWHHRRRQQAHPVARDQAFHEALLATLQAATGVEPGSEE